MTFKKMKGVKPTIGTAGGTAYYYGTEVEDKYGEWDRNYYTSRGEWVIHDGKYHHIYKNKRSRA